MHPKPFTPPSIHPRKRSFSFAGPWVVAEALGRKPCERHLKSIKEDMCDDPSSSPFNMNPIKDGDS